MIASPGSDGNRSVKKPRVAGESCGMTAWRHSSSESSVGTSKIVGANSGGSIRASSVSAWAALGGEVQRARVALIPAQRRRQRVNERIDPSGRLDRGAVGQAEEVPARLVVGGVAIGEVDLHHPFADAGVGEVGLDLGDRVGVRIEEQAAVAGAGQRDELADRRLGLAIARPTRHVGKERVGHLHPDRAPAGARLHPAQRDHPRLAACTRAARAAAPGSTPCDRATFSAWQWTVGGLSSPWTSRGETTSLRRAANRPEARRRSKRAPAPRQVLAQESEAAEAQPASPQVVGRAQARPAPPAPSASSRAPAADRPPRTRRRELELQQRMLRGELAIQRLGVVTALDRLPTLIRPRRGSPASAAASPWPRRSPSRRRRTRRASPAASGRTSRTSRACSPRSRVEAGDRRRHALEQVGLQAGLGQRLTRRARQHQPGPDRPDRTTRHRHGIV